MDRTEASDAFDAGSIPVGRSNVVKKEREIVLKKKKRRRRNRRRENPVLRWLRDVVILIINNKIIALIVLAFVVVAIIGVVIVKALSKEPEPVEEVAIEEEVVSNDYVITDEPLQVDAIPEINALMSSYYKAAASGDTATITSIKTGVEDKENIVIAKKAEYVEDYPVVTCYTKSGPVADSYIVFAYYEVKLFDYEQTVPGLNAWYVCKRDDGTYYINDDDQDEKLANYCKAISVQDDYVDLTNTVNVKFNEAVAADEKLAAFLDKLPDLLTAAVGEELDKANEPEVVEQPEETDTVVVDTTEKQAKATDVVNVRESDSESADKLGKVQKGDTLTVVEQKINGWSKVVYKSSKGDYGYIKSEYLSIIGEDGNTEASTANETVDEQALANSPSSGKAKAKDTVNIRESASTTADKVAVAYKGEEMTVVEKQSDGWSKVKFNGKTGYVKSEYLE